MSLTTARIATLLLCILPACAIAGAEETTVPAEDATSTPQANGKQKDPWIDRAHQGVFNAVWRSAMRVDGWFHPNEKEDAAEASYMEARGSIAPALLYDEFDGFQPRFRFQLDVPLPAINERLHAFIGRVNRDEYVTEREPGSGAFARQYGRPVEDDETLLGIRYREPRQGGRFEADAGIRIRSPIDPFVKGSYRFERGTTETTLLSLRETVFWQNSEKFGLTSRLDIERVVRDFWLFRWTASGTISQRTHGVRGYGAFNAIRGLPNRRAICGEIFTEGEFDADVPMENYGVKLAYRRSIARDWLVLETRVSLTFPREEVWQHREASLGVGVGLEMFFGTNEFLARPVTF